MLRNTRNTDDPAFLIHDRVTGQCHADGDDDEDDDGDGDGDDDDDDDDDDVSLWCAALSIVDRVSTCLDFSSSSPRCRAASALALDPSAAPVRCFFFLLSPCADPLVRRQGVRGCNDSPNLKTGAITTVISSHSARRVLLLRMGN